MDIETQYLAALKLTHQMLSAATALDWDALVQLQTQRTALLAATPPLATLSLTPAQTERLAQTIAEIERDNAEILDIAQVCQEHTKILLRASNTATA